MTTDGAPTTETLGTRLRALAQSFPVIQEILDLWILDTLPDVLFEVLVRAGMQAAEEGKFSCLVIWKFDELATLSSSVGHSPSRNILCHRRSCGRMVGRLALMLEERLTQAGIKASSTVMSEKLMVDMGW